MPDNDVFISYRRKDMDFVRQLRQELIDRGISAWFDMENIEVADHWRSSIAEGIRDCKIFVLVLSPDAVVSINIRKEVDLAEKHGKKIVPLMWRQTEIPVAFEYALAGLQWIDFKETASPENFDELADVVNKLLGGSSMEEATSNKQAIQAPAVPSIDKGDAPSAPAASAADGSRKLGGQRRLGGGLKKKSGINPMVIGGLVISNVVTSFELGIEDQDYVNGELKWLFSASATLMKIDQGQDPSQPVPGSIPDDAVREATATGVLTSTEDQYGIQYWGQVESKLSRINTYLRNLNILLDQEVSMGPAAQGDVTLQNQIRSTRLSIVKVLQELAQLINQAYGILVTSPDQLKDLLETQ